MDKNKIAVLEDRILRQNREILLAYKNVKDKDIQTDSLYDITPEDVLGTIILFYYIVEMNIIVGEFVSCEIVSFIIITAHTLFSFSCLREI